MWSRPGSAKNEPPKRTSNISNELRDAATAVRQARKVTAIAQDNHDAMKNHAVKARANAEHARLDSEGMQKILIAAQDHQSTVEDALLKLATECNYGFAEDDTK